MVDLPAIKKQVEYYFGDVNFPRDKHLRAKSESDEKGFVDISELLTFNRMIRFGATVEDVAQSLVDSEVVLLDGTRKRVKRKHALVERPDWRARTVYAKGWTPGSKEPNIEDVEALFEPSGEVLSVRIRRWADDEGKHFRGSIFIEMATAEMAERAVAEDYSTKVINAEGKEEKRELITKLAEDYFTEKAEERRERYRKRKERTKESGEKFMKEKSESKTENGGNANGAGNGKKEEKKIEMPEPVKRELVRGMVLKFAELGDGNIHRNDIKNAVSKFGDVAWVGKDIGACEGYVRFRNEGDAKKAVDGMVESKQTFGEKVPTWTLLEGEEEEHWWKANWDAMDEKNKKRKFEGGGRSGGRGRGGKRGRRGGRFHGRGRNRN